ncbi:MAG: zinc ribbon domain-containing protein [Ruminococcus sp.]|nr:zinc ribbon domain-containing protein [Ruminococcus sp.]
MGFLDQVKNIADSVGNTVTKGAKTGTENVKKMAEKSRIKREIAMIEADINNSYMEIGKKFFETISKAPSEEYAFDVDNIIAKNQQLEEAKKSLMELEDKFTCPECGASVTKEQKFCDKCGNKLEQFVKADVVEVVEEVKINEGSEYTPTEDTEKAVDTDYTEV